MERNGRSEGGASQLIKANAKREAHLCVPEPLSCHQERWGNLCREHGDRKGENKDKKTSETEEDIWKNRKAKDREAKRNPQQVETRSRANRSGPRLFFCKRIKYQRIAFFFSSVNEKYFYPHKRKD